MTPASPTLTTLLASVSIYEATTIFIVVVATIPTARLIQKLFRPYFSALKALPGPEAGYFSGNLKDIRSVDNGVWHDQMLEKYGPVFAYKEIMGVSTFCGFLLPDER